MYVYIDPYLCWCMCAYIRTYILYMNAVLCCFKRNLAPETVYTHICIKAAPFFEGAYSSRAHTY